MVVAGGCQWDGMFSVLPEGEVDGDCGVGDVGFAQEADDVEGVFVSFGGDLHGQKCFAVGCLDGESVEFLKGDPAGVVGDECRCIGVEPVTGQVVVGGHLGHDRVDAGFLGVAGIDVRGGTVADALQDGCGAADEFDVAMNATGRDPTCQAGAVPR